jgi:hypothetical protein
MADGYIVIDGGAIHLDVLEKMRVKPAETADTV